MRKLAIAAAVLGSFFAGFYVADFLAVDSCLDAGGRWQDHRFLGVCEGINPSEQS